MTSRPLLTREQMQDLEVRYFRRAGGLGGKTRFYEQNREDYTSAQINEFFTRHPVIRTFYVQRRPFKGEIHSKRANYPMAMIHADIMQFPKSPETMVTEGIVTVCCFSLLTFCAPIKSRQQDDIQNAFLKLLQRCKEFLPKTGNSPMTLLTDEDGAFVSHEFSSFMDRESCNHHFLKNSRSKAFLAEARIYRIKQMVSALSRLAEHKGASQKPWHFYIPEAIRILNHTPSKALGGFTPIEAARNSQKFREKVIYPKRPTTVTQMVTKMVSSLKRSDIKKHAKVRLRLRRWRRNFEKPSLDTVIGQELFTVDRVKPPNLNSLDRWPAYKLRNSEGKLVKCK